MVIATNIRVRESITQGEGISTPHVRCTQREPLGQLCALMLVKIFRLFSLLGGKERMRREKKCFWIFLTKD